MTFLVAFARPDVALLASDTRTTMRPDGNSDAPASGFTDDGVKIAPWGTGWLASGPSVAFRDAVLAGIRPEVAIAALEPAHARAVRERQLTISVGCGWRRVVAWDDSPRFTDAKPHEAVALCPNGSDPTTIQKLLNAYQRTIRGATLRDVLDATVALYGRVFGHCGPEGTVSPLVSVGLVYADGRRELLGPLAHDAFLQEVAHVS